MIRASKACEASPANFAAQTAHTSAEGKNAEDNRKKSKAKSTLKGREAKTLVKSSKAATSTTKSVTKSVTKSTTKSTTKSATKSATKTTKATSANEPKETKGPQLSQTQIAAAQQAEAGHSVLVLGPGGTGKSYLIQHIVGKLRAQGKTVAVTAMTGLAAFHIGGTTLHSFAGIGLGEGSLDSIIKRVRMRANTRHNWVNTDVLVVDEISMLSHELFDVLDGVARCIRRCPHEPWGGLQVIGVGDFYQLPPVRAKYCFDSATFSELFPPLSCVELTTNFRQGGDALLQGILTELRQGDLSPQSSAILTACTTKVVSSTIGIDPVYIAATRRQVDEENLTRMAALSGPEHKFRHVFLPPRGMPAAAAENVHQSMLRGVPCADELVLKIGAQVMYICNSPYIGKHNGSVGIVRSFRAFGGGGEGGGGFNPLPVVEFADGTTHVIDAHDWKTADNKVTFRQIPLILAFALTIHKIQGATLDCARIDAGRSLFEANQMYVALSRLRTIEGLYLTDFDPSRVLVHEDAVRFYAELREAQRLEREFNARNAQGADAREIEAFDYDTFDEANFDDEAFAAAEAEAEAEAFAAAEAEAEAEAFAAAN